jgi:hypothetical protein
MATHSNRLDPEHFADVDDLIIDPTKSGPLGFCKICFTERAGDTYCKKCGSLFGFYELDHWRAAEEPEADDMRKLSQAFKDDLNKKKICAKHFHRPAALRCVECGLPHCELCLYFTKPGWFSKKPRLGPLCLICFRRKTLFSSDRKRWMTLKEAREKRLRIGEAV